MTGKEHKLLSVWCYYCYIIVVVCVVAVVVFLLVFFLSVQIETSKVAKPISNKAKKAGSKPSFFGAVAS